MAKKRKSKAAKAMKPSVPPIALSYTTATTGFFSLSAELRNQIIELVCADTVTQHQTRQLKKGETTSQVDGKPSPPAFLMTSKQMYSESVQGFFANSVFHFQTLRHLESWIRSVDISKLAVAQNVFLHSYSDNFHVLPEALERTKKGERVFGNHNSLKKWVWWSNRNAPAVLSTPNTEKKHKSG